MTAGFPVHQQLPELAQIHVHQVGNTIQPSQPLSSPSAPVFNLSQNQDFSSESVLPIRQPKHWGFSFSLSPSNEYSGQIFCRTDWFDLLAVQGTLKSLLQHHSSKALILQHSAFFMVQLLHPYMTTGKTIALIRQTYVRKVMSLLFNMLSMLLMACLPLDHRKSKKLKKNIYFCFIDNAKAFDCVDHSKLWKILQEMEEPEHLTCLLRNLYAGQEPTVRPGPGTTDWFQIGIGVHQGCILSPSLFNLYAEYIMRSAGLDEAQAGVKISRRNIKTSDMQVMPPLCQKEKRN